LALHTVQPFTPELGLIRAGLERAVSQGNTSFSADRQTTRDLVETTLNAQQSADAVSGANPGGPGANQSASAMGSAAASAAFTQAVTSMQAQMLRSYESLERDQQGYASTNALLAIVNGLKSLPGRKTVVFFSEGLAIPANVVDRFQDMIHNANRAHVSVYTMDAAGLRANSMDQETRNEMIQAMKRRQRPLGSGTNHGGGRRGRGKAPQTNEEYP